MFNLIKIESVDTSIYVKAITLIYRLTSFGREVIMLLFLVSALELML